MTEPAPAVTISHPPALLLRTVNLLVRPLLRTPLAGPMREQMMVVDVTGRKTGRRYSIPLSAHRIDDALYAMTSAGWKNNFRDGATAEVLHDGTTTTVHGELLTAPAVVADLAHRCAESYGIKRAQRMMALKFRENRIPTVDEFSQLVERERYAAIRLTPAPEVAGN